MRAERRAFLILAVVGLAVIILRSVLTSGPAKRGDSVRVAERVESRQRFKPLQASSSRETTKPQPAGRQPSHAGRNAGFTARLQSAFNSTTSSTLQAQIGIGTINAEDIRETEAWANRGKPGAGAENLLDLVNFQTWIPAEVVPDGDDAGVGPLPVPEAHLYRLLAWDDLRNFWWETVATAQGVEHIDAGVIRRYPATGVRLRITGSEPQYQVRLERVPHDHPTTASQLLPAVRRVAPELGDALLDGTPFPVETAQSYPLFPLLPDPGIRLVFYSRTGIESTATLITLFEGQVIDSQVDVDSLFAAGISDAVTLEGKLTFGPARTPLAGASVSIHDLNSTQAQSNAAGEFRMENLPMLQPLQLQIRTPDSVTTRPFLPEQSTLELDPRGETTGSVLRREWNIPAYFWLNLPVNQVDEVAAESNPPFPIYALQRTDELSGIWKDIPGDHFVQDERGLSVSVREPGRYRITAVSSPCSVRYSEAAETGSRTTETTVTLLEGKRREVQLRVIDAVSREPILHAQVTLIGRNRSIPPVRGVTNSSGIMSIFVINDCSAAVTVDAAGYKTFEQEIIITENQADLDINLEPEQTQAP